LLIEPEYPTSVNVDSWLNEVELKSLCVSARDIIYSSTVECGRNLGFKISLVGNWKNVFPDCFSRSDFTSFILMSHDENNAAQILSDLCQSHQNQSFLDRLEIQAVEGLCSSSVIGEIIGKGPLRFRYETWVRYYKLTQDGAAFSTLQRVIDCRTPTLLLIKSHNEEIFGFCTFTPWKTSKTYFGNGEGFVFHSVGSSTTKFHKWSGRNSFFQLLSSSQLAVGGGSSHAVSLDSSLQHGATGICETFNSPPLCTENIFQIHDIEVWTISK
jgi:hypothetical protein